MSVRPEAAHDEKFLELQLVHYRATQRLGQHNSTVAFYQAHPRFFRAEEALAEAIVIRDAQLALVNEAIQALVDHEAKYTGWSRYFLVVSSSGLVHSSMDCHTCNKGRQATEFALLPSFSGLGADGLVKAYGPALCSVCFPNAPTSWTDQLRLPTSLTEILLFKGEDAFRTAHAAWLAKRADACPGSGERAPFERREAYPRTKYETCSHCGELQTVVTGGKFRKHNKPKGK